MTHVNAILQQPVCKRCFEGGHETNDCKEEKENFDLIGPIAAFIGARLQYDAPAINGQGNPWVSTIKVDQHKEKFWYVRVYCDLADPDLVQKKWTWLKNRQDRMDRGDKVYCHQHKSLTDLLHDAGDEAPPEFLARCTLHDAIHYRNVYMDAVRLRPHLRERICDQADHWVLLHKCINEVEYDAKTLDWNLKKFRCQNEDTLREFFRKVYNPTFRDTMELHD